MGILRLRLRLATFRAQDLLLYLEFKGFDAQPAAWRRTAACRLLSETKLGSLLEDIAIQAVETYAGLRPDEEPNEGGRRRRRSETESPCTVSFLPFPASRQRLRHMVVLPKGDQAEYQGGASGPLGEPIWPDRG